MGLFAHDCGWLALQEQIQMNSLKILSYIWIKLFAHNLNGNCRWTAIGWPHKIERQMEQTYEQLDQDEERFRKLQGSDQANFNDRLDTLQVRGYNCCFKEQTVSTSFY